MKPIDLMPHFKPHRVAERLPDGRWRVTVTPPSFMDMKGHSVFLTDEQHARYVIWSETERLIQDMLPELSSDDREILMTGLGPEGFAACYGDDDEGEVQ